jgi:anti-sigma factor RsiW
MMDHDFELKVQAYLDGELSANEARAVEQRLAGDGEATALLAELKNTSAALTADAAEIKLPEAREFFWSKIQREISRQPRPEPVPERVPIWAAWRRFLGPVGAMAGVFVALLIAVISMPRSSGPSSETSVADPGTFTYRDDNSGTTLVWLSYPSENEFAQNEAAGRLE